jgi:hypothetical protein
MTSSISDPVAEGIKAVLGTISGLKVYKWPPKELDSLPAAVIELPMISRVGPDEREDHMGAEDWNFEFPVAFYFDTGDLAFSHGQAAEIVEAFITAIDNTQTLGVATATVAVEDAKASAEVAEHLEEESRPLIRWLTNVRVYAFVTT